MAESSGSTISVIKQDDPELPEYLDFKKLRKEGLEHIGNLSGKIWTDHNAHDPGITILEVLVYALMDLGYKTNLPFEDIIAVKDNRDIKNDFLTPLDILTINPVTITDYRKLLLEIKGVRNAWLEVVDNELLYIDEQNNRLSCDESVNDDDKYGQIDLNGLYKVYIEKENDVNDDNDLRKEVKELLSNYRNLCEDFVEVVILETLNIGVCVEAELHPNYNTETVYKKIIIALRNFIQPEINYYTLNELLDKGKTIDDIFAGRPYREESFGFVDTEEFEKLERRKEIHLSDVYSIILNVEGVRKVKNIHVSGGTVNNEPSYTWIEGNEIPDGKVPVFLLDETCVDLYNTDGILNIDKTKIHKTFSFKKKFELPQENLDTEVPVGMYRKDLNDYYSIQNDFPNVYGIGEGDIGDSAPLLRKTQALQLKGYLMFYDQMLANYTSQLANIRSLFSLKSEQDRTSEEKQTYFAQVPETIPGLKDLLRFYNTGNDILEGSVLALPVANNEQWQEALNKLKSNPRTEFTIGNYCEGKEGLVNLFTLPSSNERLLYIKHLIESFSTKNYTVEILHDRFGYFFVLCPAHPKEILIVGTKRYELVSEAKKEAKNVAFISTISENYNSITNKSDDSSPNQHYFGITYQPISYMNLIQEITEGKEEYVGRRKLFLDHLLARFGEEFTDYTILQFRNKVSESELNENKIKDQSLYLNEFAEVSRNRGKAFNYLEPSWNSDNVSGFEKRISLLSGMNNYERRNLCNFEVSPSYRMLLKDWDGNMLFRSNRSYETKNELNSAAKNVLSQLRNCKSNKQLEKKLNGFDAQIINRIFSEESTDENIVITKYHYNQQLVDANNKVIVESKNKKISAEKIAIDRRDEFVKKIDEQSFIEESDKEEKEYRLLPTSKKDCYLNTKALKTNIKPLISWKWHVNELMSKENFSSDQAFKDQEEAWSHMVNEAQLDSYLTKHTTALKWSLKINDNILFQGLGCYSDRPKAITAWSQGKALGSAANNYSLNSKKTPLIIELKSEKGNVIARSNEIDPNEIDLETVIDDCVRIFSNRKARPTYIKEKEKYSFKIQINDSLPSLESYCAYDSKKEALQEISKVFELGENKKHYLQSGDQGNPEYNFILKDKYNSFLALPSDHFEIASDRNKALNTITAFFKKNDLPVYVNEEPRRYEWSLYENDEIVLESESEFSTKAKAQSNLDKTVVSEALKENNKLYSEHLYDFRVEPNPVQYNFIYGISNSQNEFEPIFKSNSTYKTPKEASEGYADFVKTMPALTLKSSKGKGSTYEFALYGSDKTKPVAIQYKKEETKATLEKAEKLNKYISRVYSPKENLRDKFITSEMSENQDGLFEWRFYKKNSPLAKSPYSCDTMELAGRIKSIICDISPPINLKECPPNEIIVRPDKNPGKYHYQVCFKDDKGNDFTLFSYVGYTSSEEAKEAWQNEWLEVIEIAKNQDQYGPEGKISLEEVYKDPESNACNDASFIAVIPEEVKIKIEAEGKDLIGHYMGLADLFPIYKISDDTDEKCDAKYKFKVIVPLLNDLINTGCTFEDKEQHLGSVLWEGIDCYNNYEDVLAAYQYFYRLAGTSNNCRILCEKGKYRVGLVEVLAESSCDFNTEAAAWDDMFPENKNDCEDCIPKGVREFVYAADDEKNYIPMCTDQYWKFKIVSPDYFVVNHNCQYGSEVERDEQMLLWETALKNLDWEVYDEESTDIEGENNFNPVYKTENGYCYRLYWPENDKKTTEEGLQPCGCEDDSASVLIENVCNEPFPFISSNCYTCSSEALAAFNRFKDLIINESYTLECVTKAEYGPYSFQIIDKSKELACHPQQYDSLQEVKDAIKVTMSCIKNEGMHLLEHILLRPGNKEQDPSGAGDYLRNDDCLLPICPDYSCSIEWKPDMERDDPCAEVNPEIDYYLPGTDPYSFWATVVLPAWAKRFRTQEARQAFEFLLYKEIPALVGLNILWLSPRDMCKFEDEYVKWIEWKQDPEGERCNPSEILPDCSLVKCIKELETEHPCESASEAQGKCNCDNDQTENNGQTTTVELSVDECCLPPDTTGTIFWNVCNDQQIGYPEEGRLIEKKQEIINIVKEEKPVVKRKQEVEKKTTVTKKARTKEKTEEKKETPIVKKKKETVKKEVVKKETKPDLLALARQRKPKYISNIETISDDDMAKTKSYERTIFFLQNIPTVSSYVQLVNFFKKYSLQKDNDVKGFLTLLKNATWHLFDKLVLDQKEEFKKEDFENLKTALNILKKKGMALNEISKEWNSEELKSLVNTKPLNQIKKLLK